MQKTITQVTFQDDISGTVFDEGEGETFRYSFDGKHYEIDLNTKNAEAFRKVMAKYVDNSREVTGKSAPTASRSDLNEVRTWARANGHEVSDRGRVPNALLLAYDRAHEVAEAS